MISSPRSLPPSGFCHPSRMSNYGGPALWSAPLARASSVLHPRQIEHPRHSSQFAFPQQPLPGCSHNRDENMNRVHDEALEFVVPPTPRNRRDLQEMENERRILAVLIKEHFTCPICLDVLIDATVVTCGHRFCQPCIETWLKVKPVCPVCQKKVTVRVKSYDLDNVIDSVSDYFSDEWNNRRLINDLIRERKGIAPSTPSYEQDNLAWLTNNVIRVTEKCCQIGLRAFESFLAGFLSVCDWVYDNAPAVAKGVLAVCLLIFGWYICAYVTNFVQYMYLAMVNFKKDVPAHQQIDAIKKSSSLKPTAPSKYQGFYGKDDTIFAEILRRTYDW